MKLISLETDVSVSVKAWRIFEHAEKHFNEPGLHQSLSEMMCNDSWTYGDTLKTLVGNAEFMHSMFGYLTQYKNESNKELLPKDVLEYCETMTKYLADYPGGIYVDLES